jgi:hypothetical protein
MLAAFLALALRDGLGLHDVAMIVAKAVSPPAAVFCFIRYVRAHYDGTVAAGASASQAINIPGINIPGKLTRAGARRCSSSSAASVRELFPYLESLDYERGMINTPHAAVAASVVTGGATDTFYDGSSSADTQM